MALLLGIIACIGATLASKDYKIGKYLLLISGIIAFVGSFIPIGYSAALGRLCVCPIYLVSEHVLVIPFLILIGGILTFQEKP